VRTARTAAALMIGLALVTLVATLGAGMRGTAEESLDNIVDADYVLTSENGYSTFPAAAGEALAAVDGVQVASSIRSDNAVAFGEEIGVMGMDRNADQTFNVFLVEGSALTPGALAGDQAILRESFAEQHDLAIGDRFQITTAAAPPIELTVGVAPGAPVDRQARTAARQGRDPPGDVRPGVPAAAQRVLVRGDRRRRRPAEHGGPAGGRSRASRTSRWPPEAGWVEERASGLDMVLNLFYVLSRCR
jgi:hypothetical protein